MADLQLKYFQVLHNKFQLPPCYVPVGLSTIMLIIIICSPLRCSSAKSDGFTSTLNSSRRVNSQCHLGSYMENSPFELSLTDKAAFCIPNLNPEDGLIFDASLTISFNVSIYQQVNNNQPKGNSSTVLFLAMHHFPIVKPPYPYRYAYTMSNYPDDPSYCLRPRTSLPPAAPSNLSVEISRLADSTVLWVKIDMDYPPHNSASSVENIYSITIRYSCIDGLMFISVSGDGMQQAVDAKTMLPKLPFGMYAVMYTSICHFSSMGHVLKFYNWQLMSQSNNYDSSGVNPGRFLGLAPIAVAITAIVVSVAAVAITATIVYFYFNSKYRKWKNEQDRLAKIMQGLPGVPTKVDFTDIKRATKNVHETMKLGKGGFGAVYRCTLPASSASRTTGQAMEVAVKKFMQEVEDRRYNDFLAEVSIINCLRHKNIVPLVGWSYDKGVPLLVYEYMKNGSLDQHLFRRDTGEHNHKDDAAIWKWDTRYRIVRDIATGLRYVHHEHEPMVLHRDIKASNIMLDSTFRARLGDFGIACTVAANKTSVTGIAGTFGYIAPDYAMSHKATRQTDIYAFGVLILEVVTGKKNADVLPDDDHITEWVWRLHREGVLVRAADNMLTTGDKKQDDVVLFDEAKRLLLLGLACTNPNPSNRPSMAEIVQIINKLAPTPEVPLERPAFVWPPEDWRTRNSVYSTAITDWERSSTSTIELMEYSQEPSTSDRTEERTFVHSEAGTSSGSV